MYLDVEKVFVPHSISLIFLGKTAMYNIIGKFNAGTHFEVTGENHMHFIYINVFTLVHKAVFV